MNDLPKEYKSALELYIRQGGEPALKLGYELGRRAMADGSGVLDLVSLHAQTLAELMLDKTSASLVGRAGEFFSETMSPFEMTHRAFGEANATLQRLNDSLEEETRKLANTLHDESGQLLSAVHIQLQEIARDLPAETGARIDQVRELLNQIEQQLRQFSHELRPAILDDYGLAPAVQSLADRYSKRSGLHITVDTQMDDRLPRTVEIALYRITQEALNNVAKHARATRIDIRLRRFPREFHCCIRDDGVGFDPAKVGNGMANGLGLAGMRERLKALGATLQIRSAAQKGTELTILVPLEV